VSARPEGRLAVAVFSGGEEEFVLPLVARLAREPWIDVRMVLLERRERPFRARWKRFVRQHGYSGLVGKGYRALARRLSPIRAMDRLAHPERPGPRADFDAFCAAHGIAVHRVGDFHVATSVDALRAANVDVGIVYGTRILKEAFFGIPRLGSINIHTRKVPEYRGGGPIGFHEMLRGEKEIGVTIHQVATALDAGDIWAATTMPIDERDVPETLGLKARALGRELFVEALAKIARGEEPRPQTGTPGLFKAPSASERAAFRRRFARRYAPARPHGLALLGKRLLAAAYLYCGWVQLRNARRRAKGSVPGIVVNFHRVADRRGEHWMTIGTADFDAYVAFLKRFYRIVTIDEMRRILASGANREPIVAITFDDGYLECATAAAAVLENATAPAAFYVCSGYLDAAGDLAHDESRGLANIPKMGVVEIRDLVRRAFEVGSHTVSHCDFRSADAATIDREIADSKTAIESALGTPIRGFSVPFGSVAHCRPEAFESARRHGYAYVLSHFDGANFPGATDFHLRRVRPSLDSVLLMHAAVEGWRGVSGIVSESPQLFPVKPSQND
jgi:peptidoglycan/xylan/chitin deacetylase (PgdA/CDA1 family)/folate-dependent phosphoribosylglycinamide formyltransferase PurN